MSAGSGRHNTEGTQRLDIELKSRSFLWTTTAHIHMAAIFLRVGSLNVLLLCFRLEVVQTDVT